MQAQLSGKLSGKLLGRLFRKVIKKATRYVNSEWLFGSVLSPALWQSASHPSRLYVLQGLSAGHLRYH
ncbi:hypothetical protein SAMN05216175_11177 [Neptunomonas qingdaonensis]|uniref:Uncharacterized protein n=1 Tax=Neptunomonas qingdaonensis TaxID=1045558 RepID=A0A1I2TXE7_9GAMM|nr:hypothetical protein SAMN05216175_11177 [Neptunomonas qingdaonensis]